MKVSQGNFEVLHTGWGGGTQHPFVFNGLGGGFSSRRPLIEKCCLNFYIVGVIEKVGLHGQVCQVFSVKQIETLHWPFSWFFLELRNCSQNSGTMIHRSHCDVIAEFCEDYSRV